MMINYANNVKQIQTLQKCTDIPTKNGTDSSCISLWVLLRLQSNQLGAGSHLDRKLEVHFSWFSASLCTDEVFTNTSSDHLRIPVFSVFGRSNFRSVSATGLSPCRSQLGHTNEVFNHLRGVCGHTCSTFGMQGYQRPRECVSQAESRTWVVQPHHVLSCAQF